MNSDEKAFQLAVEGAANNALEDTLKDLFDELPQYAVPSVPDEPDRPSSTANREANTAWFVTSSPPKMPLGVFTSKESATRCAEHFDKEKGPSGVEIVDSNEGMGIFPPELAERRHWFDGTIETRFYINQTMISTVAVSPRAFGPPINNQSTAGIVFLALISTESNLNLVSVNRTKDGAWNDCQNHAAILIRNGFQDVGMDR